MYLDLSLSNVNFVKKRHKAIQNKAVAKKLNWKPRTTANNHNEGPLIFCLRSARKKTLYDVYFLLDIFLIEMNDGFDISRIAE